MLLIRTFRRQLTRKAQLVPIMGNRLVIRGSRTRERVVDLWRTSGKFSRSGWDIGIGFVLTGPRFGQPMTDDGAPQRPLSARHPHDTLPRTMQSSVVSRPKKNLPYVHRWPPKSFYFQSRGYAYIWVSQIHLAGGPTENIDFTFFLTNSIAWNNWVRFY